jgi:hypothetical protein
MAKRSSSSNSIVGIIPFTPSWLVFYALVLIFSLYFYRKKASKKLKDSKNQNGIKAKTHFNCSKFNCGDAVGIFAQTQFSTANNFDNLTKPLMEYREKCKSADTCDESTMNNLDEIDDTVEKALNGSNSSILVRKSPSDKESSNDKQIKRAQIGFDIFESTLKEINTMKGSSPTESLNPLSGSKFKPAIFEKIPKIFQENQIGDSSFRDNTVFMRKFKNSLLTGHKSQNSNFTNLNYRNHNNNNNNNNGSVSNNNDQIYYQNHFEQDYKKERFLSNNFAKSNSKHYLLGQQQALKNHQKIFNSNSQLSTRSTSTFFSTADFVQNMKQ